MSSPAEPIKETNSTATSMLSYVPAAGSIAGLIIIITSLILQMFTINHGTSGQLTIDTGNYGAIWPQLIGVAILAVSFTMWVFLQKDPGRKFLYLYVFVGFSYLLSNIALFFATRQVTVSTS